ncbi:MAG: hypothetical protein H6622_09485 [Halobacteriovoraceae bacterium]|nr:hypothetical protein [Halobacteriovoraceae bacterium]
MTNKINSKNIFHLKHAFAKYSINESLEISGTLLLNSGLECSNLLDN